MSELYSKELVPEIGISGSWVFRQPFDTVVSAFTVYECIEVKSIKGSIAQGIDAYAQYYLPHGVSANDYNDDYANNRKIITLQSGVGQILEVPSSFLISTPAQVGVTYASIGVALSLSVIPTQLDIRTVVQELVDLAKARLGVNVIAQTALLTQPIVIGQTQHEHIEAVRLARITANQSMQVSLAMKDQIIANQAQMIALLEAELAAQLASP
jgi:hypothetical protein